MKRVTVNTLVSKAAVRAALGVVAGIGLATFGFSQASLAQVSTSAQPLQDFQNQDQPADPFSNRGNNQINGVMDMIHRAVLGPSRSPEEFNAEQQENLNSAAAEFRARQMERLRGQTPAATTTPATAPGAPAAPANPAK